jgi:hypothetical protein
MPRLNDLHTYDTLVTLIDEVDAGLKLLRVETDRIKKNGIKEAISIAHGAKIETGVAGLHAMARELRNKLEAHLDPHENAPLRYRRGSRRRGRK